MKKKEQKNKLEFFDDVEIISNNSSNENQDTNQRLYKLPEFPPLPSRNPNLSKGYTLLQWQENSKIFKIRCNGVEHDVFQHPFEDKYYIVKDSMLKEPSEAKTLCKELCELV